MGDGRFGIDLDTVDRIAADVKEAYEAGTQICMVIGGGNIFRGLAGGRQGHRPRHRRLHGHAGDRHERAGDAGGAGAGRAALPGPVGHPHENVCEPYIRRRAIRHMEKGRVVIFAAGTGNPFFTTDTAAALRAAEMTCDAMLKGTQVDGVYSADPKKVPDAERYDSLSYHEVLARNLQVMDASAISLSRENRIPILVFSIHEKGAWPRCCGARAGQPSSKKIKRDRGLG